MKQPLLRLHTYAQRQIACSPRWQSFRPCPAASHTKKTDTPPDDPHFRASDVTELRHTQYLLAPVKLLICTGTFVNVQDSIHTHTRKHQSRRVPVRSVPAHVWWRME